MNQSFPNFQVRHSDSTKLYFCQVLTLDVLRFPGFLEVQIFPLSLAM